IGSLDRLVREYSAGRRVMAGDLVERFGGQVAQMLGAVEHRSERIRRCVSEERRPQQRRWAAWTPKIRRRLPAMTLRASCDYRHDQLRPCPSAHRVEEAVDRAHKRLEPDAPMLGQVWTQVVRAASPLVDSSAPVAPRVMKAARRDLDQALVKT